MSNYTYADLFDKSASKKEITIETEDKSVKITNSEIHFSRYAAKGAKGQGIKLPKIRYS